VNCTFAIPGHNERTCPVCGNVVRTSDPPETCHAECGAKSAHQVGHTQFAGLSPGFFTKLANFARAAVNQLPLVVEAVLTGDESVAARSQEEIATNFAICQGCELFRDGACSHPSCGCSIDPERSAFWSKLSWKSAHCPLEPPKW